VAALQYGQTDWRSQQSGSTDNINNYVVQAAIEKNIFFEIRDAGVFGDMAMEKTLAPNGNGMHDASVDASGTGAVWSQAKTEGDETRFSLLRIIKGQATYGDLAPAAGDFQAYMFYNVYLNEIDSPKTPVPGRMSQQRIRALIADFKGPAREAVTLWHKEEKDWDFHAALMEGQSYAIGATNVQIPGGLGKDLGLGAGVGAPNENHYTAVAGNKTTIPSQGPRSTQYKTNYITDLAALAAAGNKYATRNSPVRMREVADELRLERVKGADWDYEVICDPRILSDLLGVGSQLYTAYQISQQGSGLNGQKTLDLRGAIILDGLRFIPSVGLAKWRPKGTGIGGDGGLGDGTLTYGDGTYDRRKASFVGSNYKVGFAVLLGQGALLHSYNGSVNLVELEDENRKGWEVYGYTMRGVRRSYWQEQNGETVNATQGWLQQNSVQFSFNINTSPALV